MKRTISLLLAVIMLLALTACGGSGKSSSSEGTAAPAAPASTGSSAPSEGSSAPAASEVAVKDEIIYCQGSDLTTMDPSFSPQERAYGLYNNMFETLVRYDTDMNILPGLATEWSWENNGTDLAFTLREGVKFHDGSDFNADDVVYTMDKANERGRFAKTYESCEKVDDYHVVIHFNAPCLAALYTLTTPNSSILPSDVHAKDPEAFKFAPVGTGPYKLKDFSEGDYYTLERFEDYWGGPVKTKYLTLKIVPEASQRTILLQNGEVDVAYEVPLIDVEGLVEDKDFQVLTCPSMKNVFMEFNCASTGPLGNPKVRQALACAVDKNVIVDNLLYGYGTAADCFIPTTCNDYIESDVNVYDPARAKTLLTEAGYPDGFSFTLWTNTNQTYQEIASVIANQLSKIGVNVNVVVQDDNTSFALIEANDPSYEAILDFWQTVSGHADYSFQGALLSGVMNNFSKYANPAFDETYFKYAATLEGAERTELLKQLYGYLNEDTPSVVLYNEVKYVATTAKLQGLQLSQVGAHYYGNAYVVED